MLSILITKRPSETSRSSFAATVVPIKTIIVPDGTDDQRASCEKTKGDCGPPEPE